MTRDERRKAIANAVAAAAGNALVPTAVKVGFAAMAEELREQDARIQKIETMKGDTNGR